MNELPYYCSHNDKEIKGFRGEYRFLSNFWTLNIQIYYDGFKYNTTENAFQAAKVHRDYRSYFFRCSPAEAKKAWKGSDMKLLYTSEQWDKIKYDIMAGLVFDKFLLNIDLRQKLLDTGDRYIEESNCWHDVYWGKCYCLNKCNGLGQNNLGKILMKVREFWK